MSKNIPSSWKRCATCAYWAAKRDIDYSGLTVKIDDERADCLCRRGGQFKMDKYEYNNCSYYDVWAPIKR